MRMSEEDWDLVVDTNLKGAFHFIQNLQRPMMKQHYGRIINITSISGLVGQAGQVNYSASKAGLIGLTKALAKEVAGRQVTVNAVAPGFITTDMTKELPEAGPPQNLGHNPFRPVCRVACAAPSASFFSRQETNKL